MRGWATALMRAALASGAVSARSNPRGSWAARWRAVERRRVGHAWEKEEARGTEPIPGAGPMTCARELGFRAGRSREGGGNGGEAGPTKREKEEWAKGENVGPRAKMREDFFLLFLNHFLFLVSNPKPNSNQF